MVQDRNNLPEGTDKIIPGAADRGGIGGAGGRGGAGGGRQGSEDVVVTETTVVAEMEVPAPNSSDVERPFEGSGTPQGTSSASGRTRGGNQSTGGGGSGSGSSGTGGKILDKVRSGGEKLSGQAADKTRDFVGQGLDRTGEALTNVSRLVSDTAAGLDERLGPEYGDYARRAAEAIDSTAQRLRSKDPDELIDDTRNFVRKSPGVALAGAAIVGFALVRLVKSGLDGSRPQRGTNDRLGPDTRSGTGGQDRSGGAG